MTSTPMATYSADLLDTRGRAVCAVAIHGPATEQKAVFEARARAVAERHGLRLGVKSITFKRQVIARPNTWRWIEEALAAGALRTGRSTEQAIEAADG